LIDYYLFRRHLLAYYLFDDDDITTLFDTLMMTLRYAIIRYLLITIISLFIY